MTNNRLSYVGLWLTGMGLYLLAADGQDDSYPSPPHGQGTPLDACAAD